MPIERVRAWAAPLLVAAVMLVLLAWVWPRDAPAPGDQPPIALDHGEFVFSTSPTPPASGWRQHAFPSRTLLALAHREHVANPTVWVRFGFDRARFGNRPISLYAASIQQDYTIQLNGVALARSRGDEVRARFAWNHPIDLPLPASALRAAANAITLRITTVDPQPLVVGALLVGPDAPVRAVYDREVLFATVAPQVITGYLLIVSISALAFWYKRPQQGIFAWLALVGLVWMFRNLHCFVTAPPFAPGLFWSMTTDSLLVVMPVLYGFAVRYFRAAHARPFTLAVVVASGAAILLRHALIAAHQSELPAFLVAVPLSAGILAMLGLASYRDVQPGRWLMLGAIACAVGFAFHDLGWSIDLWTGAGLALHPFGGLLVFAAFSVTMTNRLQDALVAVEDDNQTLEARAAAMTLQLQQSEASRAQLQVAQALDCERERIMREIHDGIGSNLVTALAVAQRGAHAPDTVGVLRRSLTDLKIAVDSLEPIEGDIVALLASLRHRMEADIERAGLAMVWNVTPCPPVAWLNPIGALHILRILQEAIGNTLMHAAASTITIGCAVEQREHRSWIVVTVRDDGTGRDALASPTPGRGLANSAARAEAIGGEFKFATIANAGSVTTLSMPV